MDWVLHAEGPYNNLSARGPLPLPFAIVGVGAPVAYYWAGPRQQIIAGECMQVQGPFDIRGLQGGPHTEF